MEIWQEIRKNGENGAKRLVSEYGNRLYAAAILLCADEHEAEELVFRTFDRVIDEIAGMLSVPPGTVKSRLHNARKELCELLNRQKKEECHD